MWQNFLTFKNWIISLVYIDHLVYLVLHQRAIGFSHLLVIMNSTIMNVGGCTDVSLKPCFQYFWVYIQKNMPEHMQFYFQFFEEPHIVFLGSCTGLHSYQQRTRVPISQSPCQHLLYSLLLHLNWYEVVFHLWFLFVFPLWLMILNIFYVLFSHLHIFLEKYTLKSFAHLKNTLVVV